MRAMNEGLTLLGQTASQEPMTVRLPKPISSQQSVGTYLIAIARSFHLPFGFPLHPGVQIPTGRLVTAQGHPGGDPLDIQHRRLPVGLLARLGQGLHGFQGGRQRPDRKKLIELSAAQPQPKLAGGFTPRWLLASGRKERQPQGFGGVPQALVSGDELALTSQARRSQVDDVQRSKRDGRGLAVAKG
jgi:hypothetical protein